MARYRYDRYTVRSNTTYCWEKYEALAVYGGGTWGGKVSIGEYDSYRGWASSYDLDTKTGNFYSTSSGATIYPGSSSYQYDIAGSTVFRYYYSTTAGSKFVYKESKTSVLSHYYKGAYITYEYGGYSAHPGNGRDSDGYWYVRGNSTTSYSKGTYIDTVVAEDGTYPDNDRVGTTYWYVKTGKAFPEFTVRQNGQLKTAVDGWVRVNGQLKQIQQMWIRINGSLKEV